MHEGGSTTHALQPSMAACRDLPSSLYWRRYVSTSGGFRTFRSTALRLLAASCSCPHCSIRLCGDSSFQLRICDWHLVQNMEAIQAAKDLRTAKQRAGQAQKAQQPDTAAMHLSPTSNSVRAQMSPQLHGKVLSSAHGSGRSCVGGSSHGTCGDRLVF
jgi:hypothetical protein